MYYFPQHSLDDVLVEAGFESMLEIQFGQSLSSLLEVHFGQCFCYH
jgi:hypothetical protein